MIKKISKKEKIETNVYVGDIETVQINQIHYPFMIGFKKINTEIEEIMSIDINIKNTDIEKNSSELIIKFFKIMLKISKNKKTYIYFHNLGSFDGIILLNSLNIFSFEKDFKDMKVIIKNYKIFEIKIKKLIIRDSLNLIPGSLKMLSENLVQERFRKKDIDYKKFDTLQKIKENENEIKEYMKYDLIALEKVMEKLIKTFINIYNVDITKTLTTSSLAFKIFRKIYMKKENIHKSNQDSKIEKFLRESYFGGLNNVFKPKYGKCYYYDVNSLYPYSMLKYMPVGLPLWLNENEIKNINIDDFFGFIECEIYVPENINIPPLPIRHEKVLITPVGYISGVWFSEEIKNSIKYGCKIISIKKALKYEKEIIFNDYVKDLYEKKKKNDDNKMFYKLLLNSLYGRFALKPILEETRFFEKNDIIKYEIFYEFNRHFDTSNEKILATIKFPEKILEDYEIMKLNIDKKTKLDLIKLSETHKKLIDKLNIATQISSAISSYSRIHMIQQMNEEEKNGNIILYTDTDSIIVSKELEKTKVSDDEIGKFKLEHIVDEGIFLAPKIYIMKINDKWKITFKGFSKNEKKNLENDEKKLEKLKNFLPIKTTITNNFKKNLKELIIKTEKRNIFFTLLSKKREKIYDKNGNWIDTKPIKIPKT